MKKIESSLRNMLLVLTGVAVVMGGILALTNHLTEAAIARQEKKALTDGITKVMGGMEVTASEQPDTVVTTTDEKGKTSHFSIYRVTDGNGLPLGAAVQDTVSGFGGPLVVLVGFDNSGAITGYTLLKHSETPGLGAKADQWFQADGKGSIIGRKPTADSLLTVTKKEPANDKEVQAITASTISSRAFILAVNNAYQAFIQSSK